MTLTNVLLGDSVAFSNGKSPKLVDGGAFCTYGSNGIIGKSDEFNHENSIILGRVGAYCGSVHICPEKYWASDNTIIVNVDESQDLKYWYYRLKSFPVRNFAGGAAQPLITQTCLKPIQLNVHSDLVEQKKVSFILSSYDDLIENNRRRIALLEESARLLYKEWFVHLRFPGHEHVKVVDGVPEGWGRKPLGDLLTLQRGFDLPVRHRKAGSVPIYASTGINGFHNTAKVKDCGVVTGRSGSLGKVMYVQEDFWPLNTALWVKEFKAVTPIFATHLLTGMHLEMYNGGAAVPTLNRNDVHRVDVLSPSDKLINEFEEISKITYSQLHTLEKYNDKLAEARDLLLPRLMNGEIEV